MTDMDKWLTWTQARKDYLKAHAPACPECGSKQVQLLNYMDMFPIPATWKCRRCKRVWDEEPEGAPKL